MQWMSYEFTTNYLPVVNQSSFIFIISWEQYYARMASQSLDLVPHLFNDIAEKCKNF